ncbi:transketolase [Enterococcus columbae DSM 7374 = ATCC 51263]|nr:transketolase [Enterococcus columbae DSM 7374 = ATCC 51263]
MERFEQQSAEYKDSVLPRGVKKRVAIEAGSSFGWQKYVKCKGKTITIDSFGASAPSDKVLASFGFTVEHVVDVYKSI